MDPAFSERSFADLQRGTVVVVPSISFPGVELRKITGILHYEERMLFALLSLIHGEVKVVYVTSLPVDEDIVDYYLSFLPDPQGARSRVRMMSVDDHSIQALSEKLLDREDFIEEVRSAIAGERDAYLLTFNVTPAEQTLAQRIGIPLFGPAPEHARYGSKSGSRRIARLAGVPVLEGAEELWTTEEVADGIENLRALDPAPHSVVIKLNHGFSGQGNAILALDAITNPLDRSPTTFCAAEETWPSYAAKIAAEGAIVEELLAGPGCFSPSVQLLIGPDGTPEVISTHDQILGDPDAQVYLGCRFPARPDYRDVIQAYAIDIAHVLASKGVIGFFGIDFLVLTTDSDFDVYLSEINLRMGGTTHPFAMASRVTGGVYDRVSGELLVGGSPRAYVGSDNLKSPAYVGLRARDAIAGVARAGLSFDASAGTGITLHLLGALPEFGKMGGVCIAPTAAEAQELYDSLERVMDEVGRNRP